MKNIIYKKAGKIKGLGFKWFFLNIFKENQLERVK